MTDSELRQLLFSEARRINSPEFIGADPVQFPRMFSKQQDVEVAALLSATIAWGNRKMICRNCAKMMALMDMQPYTYVMDEGYEDLPDEGNIHRTFFNANLKHYLRGLRLAFERHGSLEGLAKSAGAGDSEGPAWTFAAALAAVLAEANCGVADCRCLPTRTGTSALKRLNMALRWLVRADGIVDLGIWKCITPAQLYIPLDVHVSDTSRQLGLLQRRSNDRKAVEELTAALRRYCPEDPALFDYALFGIGMQL